jgi:hydroxymethylbilane synthase
MTKKILVGSRRSPLALAQTNLAISRLRSKHPNLNFEIREIRTEGDEDYREELGTSVTGKDAFTKRIEQRLLSGDIDLAVHSLKDLPTQIPSELSVGAVLEREDPRDALVSVGNAKLSQLPSGSRVGTSSLRRRIQIQAARPDLEVAELHGNIGTRIGRIQENGLEGIILAVAGLARLGLRREIAEIFETEVMLPAVGQGALVIEARKADSEVMDLAKSVEDPATRIATDAERAFSARLGGGCNLPIAAYARIIDGRLNLEGMVGSSDGERIIREKFVGKTREAENIGASLAERMLTHGASKMLAET